MHGPETNYLLYLATRTALQALRAVPRQAALAMTRRLADAYRSLDRRHTEIARVNLRIAFGELRPIRQAEIIASNYRNLARLVVEIARLSSLTPENIRRWVQYDERFGEENFLPAYHRRRGILFLTGHFSSWELLPYAHALFGYPLSFVVRPLDNPFIEGFLDRKRRECGNRTIPKRNSTRPILKVLARGESVGILIDQNVMTNEGVFVPFFGKLACTTTGLAKLALKTGAAVIPAKIRWSPSEGMYRMMFFPELRLVDTGDRDADIVANTTTFNRTLEEMIRMEPEAWLWGHRRWNTRPPEDPDDPYGHIK